jgi:hypothetical protein
MDTTSSEAGAEEGGLASRAFCPERSRTSRSDFRNASPCFADEKTVKGSFRKILLEFAGESMTKSTIALIIAYNKGHKNDFDAPPNP